MIATTILLATALAAPPTQPPPPVPVVSLDGLAEYEYVAVRRDLIGVRIQGVATVSCVGGWALLYAPKDGPRMSWAVHLYDLPENLDLAFGDRVRFDGLLVYESYAGLHLWTYAAEKLPSVEDEATAEEPQSDGTRPGDSPEKLASSKIVPFAERSTTLDELNALFDRGKANAIRETKIGYRVRLSGICRSVGDWPVIELPGGLTAELRSAYDRFDEKPEFLTPQPGDRVDVEGILLDAHETTLQVWVTPLHRIDDRR